MSNLLSGPVIPIEIEIEFTSRCNATCVACPRDHMPAHGRMSNETLERVLLIFDDMRRALPEALKEQEPPLPRVTIAGGGEPFLHGDALVLLERIKKSTSNFHVITNVSALTSKRANRLIELHPASITCSFWGISADEYERAMGLDYETSFSRLRYLADRAREAEVALRVEWVRVPELKSSDEDIRRFWDALGIPCSAQGAKLWNRGGLLPRSRFRDVDPACLLPDTSRAIWCSEIYFSAAFNWQGDCLLCCCSYFDAAGIVLGSANTHDWAALASRKQEILQLRPIPATCQKCQLPRRDQASWLAAPILDKLDGEERAMLLYEDSRQSSGAPVETSAPAPCGH